LEEQHPGDEGKDEEARFRGELEIVVVGVEIPEGKSRRLILDEDSPESSRSRSQGRVVLDHPVNPLPGRRPVLEGRHFLFLFQGPDPFHDGGAGEKGDECEEEKTEQGYDDFFPHEEDVFHEQNDHDEKAGGEAGPPPSREGQDPGGDHEGHGKDQKKSGNP